MTQFCVSGQDKALAFGKTLEGLSYITFRSNNVKCTTNSIINVEGTIHESQSLDLFLLRTPLSNLACKLNSHSICEFEAEQTVVLTTGRAGMRTSLISNFFKQGDVAKTT